jgi:hypothetical protein
MTRPPDEAHFTFLAGIFRFTSLTQAEIRKRIDGTGDQFVL